ncbi:hypothetical protein AB0H07_46500 [Streptomyces sp. NPDC021354]|uniref:hypothetical protein n=1 Tax=Streptomyces sp. NPDC021354 TaxID=3154793 RepID=UPI0033E66FA9
MRLRSPTPLPALADTKLREAWGTLGPHQPTHLLSIVRRLESIGGYFDFLPESAAREDDPSDLEPDLVCLLLSDQAEPGLWDWGGAALLRPHSVPRPPKVPLLGA